jgi:phosphoserine phosphatase RsbU/P
LAQVITNLVTNACGYCSHGSVSVRVAGRAADVMLEVHNWGDPIPEELVPELFRPFKRGSASQHRGSIGFGLFIVDQVVQAHGGTVSVRSTLEGGTTFTVTLPRFEPGEAPGAGALNRPTTAS